MIRPQDPVNIIAEIRGDQNVRDREGNEQSQRDSRPSHHTAFIASAFVSVKEYD